ncbi:MltR family transcriptional regulator [Hafnia alvei]|uniref:Mannitol operon repressor n=1 Tax=Hafnia alvei ATCC 51873 TaxID=1002364 RepID=G9Y635_HAFAL|nr:MltR family transcriptional regulator [Hafnia alvei]EHM43169.1 mannitol operon repressor [Hafnia alvei ATCC 51873]QQE44400.1 transcriptional regulator [Hafnia alvei]
MDEDNIIERLESENQLDHFMVRANQILYFSLRDFLPHVFVSDPDIQEYAVKPLLEKAGPLDDIYVSLRLIYALGQMRREVYADIFSFIQFSEYLHSRAQTMPFNHDMVYDFINNLRTITETDFSVRAVNEMRFSDFDIYSHDRCIALIKTCLSLAVMTIVKELDPART